jgi:ATP-dependent DNA ligase
MGGVEEPEEAVSPESSPILPMEAKSVKALPTGDGWQFEPKWDGFRCLAFKSGDKVAIYAKSGKPLGRFFPEVVEHVRALPGDEFVLDGELVISYGGDYSFDALQMRLHPAESRIRKLSNEIPAILKLFDMLTAPGGRTLVNAPLTVRREALETFIREAGPHPGIEVSTYTRNRAEAQGWLDDADPRGSLDGVVAKRLDGPYVSGERAMLKIKKIRTADCVVGGFRYGSRSTLMGSILLGLYDESGLLHHVGFSSSFSTAEKPELTRKLEALRGGPGFTGRAPGGPSRWSTDRTETYEPLRHELVVEVAYDHVTSERFRHGSTFIRWRPDKAPAQCTMEQLGK